MSTSHKQYVLSQLEIGVPSEDLPTTLGDWGLDEAAVLAVPDNFTFDAETSYCPLSDIPDFVPGPGVHFDVEPERCYIVIDNGMSLAMFRLTRA